MGNGAKERGYDNELLRAVEGLQSNKFIGCISPAHQGLVSKELQAAYGAWAAYGFGTELSFCLKQ